MILPGEGGLSGTLFGATELKIGYAQLSTVDQDLTVPREALAALGVDPKRIYVDHGLTGRNRERPGLRQALAACHRGDMLVVTKLDCLARSVPDPRDIADELTASGVLINIGRDLMTNSAVRAINAVFRDERFALDPECSHEDSRVTAENESTQLVCCGAGA